MDSLSLTKEAGIFLSTVPLGKSIHGSFNKNSSWRDFPGCPVVKTQCFHCRGTGLIPVQGTFNKSHMLYRVAKKEKNASWKFMEFKEKNASWKFMEFWIQFPMKKKEEKIE